MAEYYSTATVATLSGASIRMIDYWARTGLQRPSARDASGRGSKRRYSFQDVVTVCTICKLREGNCPLQKIRAAVRYLRSHYPNRAEFQALARLTLLTDGKRVYMLTDERQVMEVVTRQTVWSVPLGKLIIEANQRVESLPREWEDEAEIGGRMFHFLVARDGPEGDFAVRCRELPGTLERGKEPTEAITRAKEAVLSVVTYLERRKQPNRSAARAVAG
jgi:DNA-binding transcriptional MerR regulator